MTAPAAELVLVATAATFATATTTPVAIEVLAELPAITPRWVSDPVAVLPEVEIPATPNTTENQSAVIVPAWPPDPNRTPTKSTAIG